MPSFLLHLDATVTCAHPPGRAEPMTTSPRVKVGGKPVTTQPTTYTVSGCTQPPPPTANGPCATAQWSSGATRVKAGRVPVLLSNSQATCLPTGTPLLISVTQVRVKGT
jgi:hypothetical protein